MNYNLPETLIAQHPCEPRDASRLMVVHRATGRVEHRIFRDILDYLDPRDVLILNRTRVLPARFTARRASGGRIGGLFIQELEPGRWEVLLSGLRRVKLGERLTLCAASGTADHGSESAAGDWSMTLRRRLERGACEVLIDPPAPARQVLDEIGAMPLPPYIRRGPDEADAIEIRDRERYQTVFAEKPGAIAAPTAGLHFTRDLLDQARAKGIGLASVLLHVGLGTFQPVEVENLAQHRMHREWYELSEGAAAAISARSAAGGRRVAVGTTSVRVLESCSVNGQLTPGQGWTDIFIYAPYTFQQVDALITNFHLPGSTLLALVGAFAGMDLMRAAYDVAVKEQYRFFSYGDAMLIL